MGIYILLLDKDGHSGSATLSCLLIISLFRQFLEKAKENEKSSVGGFSSRRRVALQYAHKKVGQCGKSSAQCKYLRIVSLCRDVLIFIIPVFPTFQASNKILHTWYTCALKP